MAAAPKHTGRTAVLMFENVIEMAGIVKARVHQNINNGQIGGEKQMLHIFHTNIRNKFGGGYAKVLLEHTAQMCVAFFR